MNKELFSKNLVEKRKKAGYKTQSDFAKAYDAMFPTKRKDESAGNVSVGGILGTIKHYENPNYTVSMPSLDKVDNICTLLGCDIDYLTGRIDEESHDKKFICEYLGLSEKAVDVLHDLKESGKPVSLDRFDYSSDIDEVNGTVTVGRSVDNIEVSRIRVLEKLLLNPDFLSLLDELAIVEAASDIERNEKLSKSIAAADEEWHRDHSDFNRKLDHRNSLIKIRNDDRLKAKLAKFDASTLFANVINAIWPDQQA